MTSEANVGKFEVWVLRGIGAIISFYLGGDLAGPLLGIEITMPSVMAWTLLGLIIAYFLNRYTIKIEHTIDAWILMKQMQAEREHQLERMKIEKSYSDGAPKPPVI